MNSMIDRVATAICEAEIGGKLPNSLEALEFNTIEHWRSLARAAIKAMREPTSPMLDAVSGFRPGMIDQDPSFYWPLMIDAALSQQEKNQ